jgi:hypothetical protein
LNLCLSVQHLHMLKGIFVLLLVTVFVVSCSITPPAERVRHEPDGRGEQDIPLPVRQIRSMHVKEVRRYFWDSREITLNFITTNYSDGARVALLTGFPVAAKSEPYAYVRLGTGGRQIDYRLNLGSPLCRDLAEALAFSEPTVAAYSNRVDSYLIPGRIEKLRELLRGSYHYKSPPR